MKGSEAARPRKRNPQDATLRNTRALRKRVEALERRARVLEERIVDLEAGPPEAWDEDE